MLKYRSNCFLRKELKKKIIRKGFFIVIDRIGRINGIPSITIPALISISEDKINQTIPKIKVPIPILRSFLEKRSNIPKGTITIAAVSLHNAANVIKIK